MRALVLLCFLLLSGLAQADEPMITVTVANDMRSFTRGELLVRPDATTIEVVRDISAAIALRIAAEFRDDLVAAFLFFLFALSLELDEVLGSSLGCRRSHRAIVAANIMLPEADIEPREKEGGRLRRMGNLKIEMRERENNSFYLFCRGRGAGRKSGSSLVAERAGVNFCRA
jgi:hypothetical protein